MHFLPILGACALLVRDAIAVPVAQEAAQQDPDVGIRIDSRRGIVLLKLPYATYEATFDVIFFFKNVRFAEPPVDQLRWKRPMRPRKIAEVQDGSKGNFCVQLFPRVGMNLLGDAAFQPWAASLNEAIGTHITRGNDIINAGTEDCLYLDIYVPGTVLRSVGKNKPVPVVNWIYGGAFTLGAKEQFGLYNPTDMIKKSDGNFIWVAGNYRLGVYGWLAGDTMEKESDSNLGLYDQRAVLQWIREYIPLLGGDPTNVVAMGESAGASSIMHHLIGQGGKQDPLFQRAVMMSPAFQIMWDRKGILENVFQNFTRDAGCMRGGLDCLRQVTPEKLRKANRNIQDYAARGSFGVGPAVDGKWVRQLASVEYLEGAVWPGIESIVLTHTAQEATIFVDGHIRSDEQFSSFLSRLFPENAGDLIKQVLDFYPGIDVEGSPYQNETQRVRDFIRDSSFTCNNRYIAEAYQGKIHNMQYNTYPGWHGLDLIAAFVSKKSPGVNRALAGLFKQQYLDTFDLWRSYITTYIVTGDPNEKSNPGITKQRVQWPRPISDPQSQRFGQTLHLDIDGPSVAEDRQMPKLNCDFIQLMEQKGMHMAGYSPPGSPTPRFDEVFGRGRPKVMIDTVDPFPADVGPTVPFNRIVESLFEQNKTMRVLLADIL